MVYRLQHWGISLAKTVQCDAVQCVLYYTRNKTLLLLLGTSLYKPNCSEVHLSNQHYKLIWPSVLGRLFQIVCVLCYNLQCSVTQYTLHCTVLYSMECSARNWSVSPRQFGAGEFLAALLVTTCYACYSPLIGGRRQHYWQCNTTGSVTILVV